MRLTLRQLQIFAAVAGAGSTVAAAEVVALSQSAVSAALNELERLLGTPLFDRVGRRLVLNDGGRGLLPRARALLEQAEALERDLLDPSQGVFGLRLAASTTVGNYVLPALIAGFRRRFPTAMIAVQVSNTRGVTTAIGDFRADLGFIEGPCHEPSLRVVPWMVDELVIVAAADHPLARRRATVRALRASPWLLREPGSGTREAVEQVLLPHLYHLRCDMQFDNAEAIKRAAAEGMGLACLSRRVVENMVRLRKLAVLATTLPPLERYFYVVQRDGKLATPGVARFMAYCLEAAALAPPVPVASASPVAATRSSAHGTAQLRARGRGGATRR